MPRGGRPQGCLDGVPHHRIRDDSGKGVLFFAPEVLCGDSVCAGCFCLSVVLLRVGCISDFAASPGFHSHSFSMNHLGSVQFGVLLK